MLPFVQSPTNHSRCFVSASSAAKALAYVWNVDGNERMRVKEQEFGGTHLPVLKYPIPNSRAQIVLEMKRFPSKISNR